MLKVKIKHSYAAVARCKIRRDLQAGKPSEILQEISNPAPKSHEKYRNIENEVFHGATVLLVGLTDEVVLRSRVSGFAQIRYTSDS